MSIITNQSLNFVYELFLQQRNNALNYIYRGLFTHAITETILALAESNIVSHNESGLVKKRVHHIMVECLQNVARHQGACDYKNKYGIFSIHSKNNHYHVTTGNVVLNEEVETLKFKLEKVNAMSKDALNGYYKQVLVTGQISKKGGAGLGLIDMARKSGNNLNFIFEPIDQKFSFFYFNTKVASEIQNNEILQDADDVFTPFPDLHASLTIKNILLGYFGSFNQSGLMGLLTIVERQIDDAGTFKKRIYNIMVEMIQNVIKHADNIAEYKMEKPGAFILIEHKGVFEIFTGNFVNNENLIKLQNKLDSINVLKLNELEDYYNEMLFNFEFDSGKEAGLGFMDIKLKSESNLNYCFCRVSENVSFFVLKVEVTFDD